MIQLSPCLGPNSCTRRLERDGNLVKIVRQKTGLVEAAYQDPERILDKRFSYPGFMRSATSRKGALELIGQAYDQVENQRDDVGKAKKIMTQQQEAHMETEVLTVEISKTLHDRLKQAVGRLKSKLKSYAKTEQSLIENALTKFLDELESGDK